MARRKNEELLTEKEEFNTELTEDTSTSTTETVTTSPVVIVPPFAMNTLKAFKEYESLYVDDKGGAYTPDTKQNLVGEAILYKNPYHKQ